ESRAFRRRQLRKRKGARDLVGETMVAIERDRPCARGEWAKVRNHRGDEDPEEREPDRDPRRRLADVARLAQDDDHRGSKEREARSGRDDLEGATQTDPTL